MKQSKSTFLKTIVLSISILAFSSVSAYAGEGSHQLITLPGQDDLHLVIDGAAPIAIGADQKRGEGWKPADFNHASTVAYECPAADASCSIESTVGTANETDFSNCVKIQRNNFARITYGKPYKNLDLLDQVLMTEKAQFSPECRAELNR